MNSTKGHADYIETCMGQSSREQSLAKPLGQRDAELKCWSDFLRPSHLGLSQLVPLLRSFLIWDADQLSCSIVMAGRRGGEGGGGHHVRHRGDALGRVAGRVDGSNTFRLSPAVAEGCSARGLAQELTVSPRLAGQHGKPPSLVCQCKSKSRSPCLHGADAGLLKVRYRQAA